VHSQPGPFKERGQIGCDRVVVVGENHNGTCTLSAHIPNP
jgi:hypothetical protein